MGVCESGKNTEETSIKGGSQDKHPIKVENILNGKIPIKLRNVVKVSKSLCFIQTPIHQVQDF